MGRRALETKEVSFWGRFGLKCTVQGLISVRIRPRTDSAGRVLVSFTRPALGGTETAFEPEESGLSLAQTKPQCPRILEMKLVGIPVWFEGAKPVTSAHDRQKAAPWALSFGPPQILPRCP
ncbi:hypothetical protein CGBL_0118030 [Corynebacterium glutamicum]|nr:hypothetical protein CGBL_0118030 [Corynebacterium glutamicum]